MSLCVSVVIVQCAMCGGVAVAPITCPTHSICIQDHIPIAYNRSSSNKKIYVPEIDCIAKQK